MKAFLCLGVCFFTSLAALRAQNAPTHPSGEPKSAPGQTHIHSDALQIDQSTHTSIFTGHVVVTSTDFKMTCQEMTVVSTAANQVETIIAKGDVVIIQPGRITHSGEAQYFKDAEKIVLTISPVIDNNGSTVSSTKITIFRNKQTVITDGPTDTTIAPGHGIDTPSAPAESKAK